jgi:hypothetical protein
VYHVLPVSLDCPVLIAPSVFSNVYLSCVLCTLCCQFLWIVQFWLPLRYSLTFICPVSCVPRVASFSGLSSFDCPFDILSDIYMFLISDILNNIKTNWINTGTWWGKNREETLIFIYGYSLVISFWSIFQLGFGPVSTLFFFFLFIPSTILITLVWSCISAGSSVASISFYII